MAHSWRESIYQWLSKATVSAETPPAQDADQPPPVDSTKRFDSVPADLEDFNAAQGSRADKRNRDTGREDALEHHSSKKPRNEYERRPRHKTREDRYDYKPNGAHSKSQSRRDKTKRLRRGRKETMNDGFHASNVARERLTLRKSANVGIFNKGKASSPIKHRDVPDLAFSETQFLSQKNPRDRRNSITITMNELQDRAQKEQAPYIDARPRAERPAGTLQRVLGDTPPQTRDKADNIKPQSSHAETSGPNARHEPGEAQSITQQLQCQTGASKPESQSATPYSWSESEPSRTRLERAVDHRLLEILHTGLSSVQDSNPDNLKGSKKEYCDLQQLKVLLRDRKAYWQIEDNSSSSGCLQEKNLEPSAEDEKNADILPNLTPEVVPSSEPGLPLNRPLSEDKPCPPKSLHDYDRTEPITSSYQGRQLSQLHDDAVMEAEMEDDEAFFRRLDEAFHEIMNPGCKDKFLGGRPGGKATSLHRESLPSLLSDQLGYEIPHLEPSPIVWHPAEKPASRPGGHYGSRKLPNAPSNEGHLEQNVDDRYLTLSKQPLSGPTTPTDHEKGVIPKGFWRQNRLY